MESYKYLNLEENFFTMIQLTTRPKLTTELIRILNIQAEKNPASGVPIACKILKIVERISWIRVFYTKCKNIYTNSMIKYIVKYLKEMVNKF